MNGTSLPMNKSSVKVIVFWHLYSQSILLSLSLRAEDRQWHNFICNEPWSVFSSNTLFHVRNIEVIIPWENSHTGNSIRALLQIWPCDFQTPSSKTFHAEGGGTTGALFPWAEWVMALGWLVSQKRHILVHWHPTHVHKCTTEQRAHADKVPRVWNGALKVIRCHSQPSKLLFLRARTDLSTGWDNSGCS